MKGGAWEEGWRRRWRCGTNTVALYTAKMSVLIVYCIECESVKNCLFTVIQIWHSIQYIFYVIVLALFFDMSNVTVNC